MEENTPASGAPRPVFIVSDGTAITAETLALAVLTQFPSLSYEQRRIPFVDTKEKAIATAHRINLVQEKTGMRPLVFSTFSRKSISDAFCEACTGFVSELFRSFVNPLEEELGMQSSHQIGVTHMIRNEENYDRRIAAIDYTLTHDDGQTDFGLDEAEVILVGVSRSGKTPTSLFLAMQFGIKVANYPLIPEDFERGELPEALQSVHDKLFGLTISPERLHDIRNERKPNSRYASLANCRQEVADCEAMMNREGISYLSSTTKSIEEIAATIIATLHLEKHERIA
ncbi:MAG: kinase/pyrophosphorylase [Sutterellaceae bacterium]|nr:kinase/pyrophosphorylase [Sutterellaceae bacterium]MDD7442059.1 kinase/pyrophosphorylase [Sutterellaceae bacterium]MDY2869154.1 pyruvate, water dikinase regulatory protein [Mesosutterella sp.]